jgi:HSP20 family protein
MLKKGKEKKEKSVVQSPKAEIVPQKKWEPPRTFEDFERMLEDFWRRPFPSFFPPFPSLFPQLGGDVFRRGPSVDVYEEMNDVVVKAEIPGLTKEDVQVSLTDTSMTLSGEKKKEDEVKEDVYSYSERTYGKFSRTLSLPCKVKSDKGQATFKDGILEVRIPKTEESKKRHVTVKIK